MKRSLIFMLASLVVIGLTACGGQNPEPTVVLTPAADLPQEPVETARIELAVVTPDLVVRQIEANAPTSVPPEDINLDEMTGDSWFTISPNGSWTAQVRVAYPIDKNGNSIGDKYFVRLEVLKQDGSLRWIVVDEWSIWALGYSLPDNLHWRADSTRLYYSLRTVADGCAVFGNEQGLYEVNLEDGTVRDLAKDAYGELKASPDGELIAVLGKETFEVRELASGATADADMSLLEGDWQAGKLLWSTDQSSIVFTVMFNPCTPPGSSSIYLLNLGSMQLTALIEEDARKFVASQWLPDGKIELVDEVGAKWRLDPDSRAVEKIE